MSDHDPSPEDSSRVLRFRHRRSADLAEPDSPLAPDDLAKFERGSEADDYRHRMIMNVAAVVVVALLIAAGLWLADTMAALRKNQDCMFSGRRNCAPIEVNRDR
jgi:hypothetical protein